MLTGTLDNQLEGVGRTVLWWRAQLRLFLAVAGVIAFVCLFSLIDLWLQYGRMGRLYIWTAMIAIIAAGIWLVRRTLNRRLKSLAVAAMIEKTFPQLDNHLINYLQFAANPGEDPFKQAYVSQGAPAWSGLDIKQMKNRKRHKHVLYALVVSSLLFLTPSLFIGRAWGVAVWRVVNPFTNVQPVTLTNILSVDPGDTTVQQGSSLILTCNVQGHKGHKVSLDINPADRDATTYALGRISGKEPKAFTYRLPKVNTTVKYRFRAGDSPFPKWYTVTTRPPLGLTRVEATVIPPAYTKLKQRTYDVLTEEISVTAGSALKLSLDSNLPIETMKAQRGSEETDLKTSGGRTTWTGEFTVNDGSPLKLIATRKNGDKKDQAVRFIFEPDRVPGITVLAPEGTSILSPGAKPEISFVVTDDYGLSEVVIEQVNIGGARSAKGEILHTWKPGSKELVQSWRDENWRSREEHTLAYRIVARDNCPTTDPLRAARSSIIMFKLPSIETASKARNKLEDQAFSSLAKIIDMQRTNLGKTETYQRLQSTTAENWHATANLQREIREIMKTLLNNPLNPLGNLSSVAKNLYLNEMASVIPLLTSIPNTSEEMRGGRINRAVEMEQKILRQLTFADVSASKAKVQRRVSALTGMLARMIKAQESIIKQTSLYTNKTMAVGESLIDQQDELAMDLTDFVAACRKESLEVIANDENYSKLLLVIVDTCDDKKIRDDMMLASEQLEENRAAAAIPHEGSALRKLKELQVMLEEIMAEDQLEEQEAMLEVIMEAKKRVEKIKDLHKKAVESMDLIKDQLDKSDKDFDVLEEEYKELLAKTKDALLQIPTDLNIFMELNVANDIAEDVFSVFEEVEQQEGSEKLDKKDVKERALAKREEYLEGMEEAKDRLDELEGWLMNHPDDMKITAEAFDQEEMPKAGISLGALKTEAADLIGDLMKKEEAMSEEADDGAINTSVPDMTPGNEVKEGDVASFAAQGKSGNETPDHKEQDGRSNVGREGMATGETAAGSGTINEGDKDIEERRTQEPTQSGQIDVDGEDIQTKATGGGKLATGKADEMGMQGGVKRMDSAEAGSTEGMNALMAKQVDAMYAKASMQNVRANSLKDASHHLRQAEDAVAKGNIAQLREHRHLAMMAIKKAKAQMDAAQSGSFSIQRTPSMLDGAVEGGAQEAPPKYRDAVAEYYKILNSSL